jgi:probable addiction module antidote protein
MRRRQVAPSRSGIIKYLAPRQFRRRNGRRGARARPPPFPPIPRARPPVAVRFPPGRVVDPAAPRIHRTDANDASLLAAALGDIARARGMTEIPKSAGIARDALYMALRPESAPRFDTVRRVCRARSVDLDERQGTLGRDELEYQLLAQGQADSPKHVPAGGALVGAPLHPGDHRLLHADEGGELGLGEPLRLAHPSHRHRQFGHDLPGLVGATELRVRELLLQIILERAALGGPLLRAHRSPRLLHALASTKPVTGRRPAAVSNIRTSSTV